MLLERFRKILVCEERARHFYDHYIDSINDEAIKQKLVSIRDDEIKHIEIAKSLIKLVS